MSGALVGSGRERLKRGAGAGCITPSTSMKALPRAVVGMLHRLRYRQHGCEARLAALQQRAPFGARLAAEQLGEARTQLRPILAVVLPRQVLLVQSRDTQQLVVEFLLDVGNAHVLPVARLVDLIPGRGTVERILAALVAPHALRAQAVHEGHQRGRAVDHGGVDDLALPRAHRLDEGAEHSERKQHPAAGEIPDQVERNGRRLAFAADRVQRARERDVVEIVPRRVGQRPVLAPARHPAVD